MKENAQLNIFRENLAQLALDMISERTEEEKEQLKKGMKNPIGKGEDYYDRVPDPSFKGMEKIKAKKAIGESAELTKLRELAGLQQLNEEGRDDYEDTTVPKKGWWTKGSGIEKPKWKGSHVEPEDMGGSGALVRNPDGSVEAADPQDMVDSWWSHEDQKMAAQRAGEQAAGMDLEKRRDDMKQAWLYNDLNYITHPKDLEVALKSWSEREGSFTHGGIPDIAGEEPDLFKYGNEKNAQNYYNDQIKAKHRAEAEGLDWFSLTPEQQEEFFQREINPRTGDPYPHWTPDGPDLLKYQERKNAEQKASGKKKYDPVANAQDNR